MSDLTNQKELITPKKAMKWLTMNNSNRPLSAKWAGQLAESMMAGVFEFNGDAIRFNDKGELIDGQHRLTACVQSGKSFESYVIRGLPAKAYDTIDQGRRRQISDVFARQGYKHYCTLAAAVRWIWCYENFFTKGLNRASRSMRPDEANEILEKHPAVHMAAEKAVLLQKSRLLSPGMAAFLIYMTFQKDEKRSIDFFSRVMESDGLDKGTPGYLLNKRLILNLGSIAKLHDTVICALAIKCWNAFVTKKQVGTLRWNFDEEFPKVLG